MASSNSNKKLPGRVITFYSYKGGTGRSMALANIGWLLALAGKQVLMVDWDLEAPGLHRYFHPFFTDKELLSTEGVIDFVINFEDEATAADKTQPQDWFIPLANILRYAVSLKYPFPGRGTLDFIPAGRQGSSYSVRVNSFNWQRFYDKLGGWAFLEEAKRKMKEEYEYILIDSRTGVSDTSGICTVQMPDDLVIGFTLNNQSIEGASAVAYSVLEQRRKLPNLPIRIFPISMRVEEAESTKKDNRRQYAKTRFFPLLDHIKDEENREKYWGESSIRYIPYFAYEEILAYFKNAVTEADTLLQAMRRVASLITGINDLNLPALDEAFRENILSQFAEQKSLSAPMSPPKYSPRFLYLSYHTLDREYVEVLQRSIELRQTFQLLNRESFTEAAPWSQGLKEILHQVGAMLVFIGDHGISASQNCEVALVRDWVDSASNHHSVPIIPVLLSNASLRRPPGVMFLDEGFDLSERPNEGAFLDFLSRAVQGERTHDNALPRQYCPYQGFDPFREEDATTFFGRESAANQLLRLIHSKNLITLVAGNDAGKTSLVHAGLLPLLRTQESPKTQWLVAACSVDIQPYRNLAKAVVPYLQTASEGDSRSYVESLAEAFARSQETSNELVGSAKVIGALEKTIRSVLERSPGADKILLVVDDIDELIINSPILAESFLQKLVRVAGVAPLNILLVLQEASFNTTFVRRCLGEAMGAQDTLLGAHFQNDALQAASFAESLLPDLELSPLTPGELKRAVEGPATLARLVFESELVEIILGETNVQESGLPHLEFALTKLWEKREGNRLTLNGWAQIGGLKGCVERWAEDEFSSWSPEHQKSAVGVLSRLVKVSPNPERVPDSIRRCSASILVKNSQTIKLMVDAGLLSVFESESDVENYNPESIQLSASILFDSWPRFKQLINKDREFLIWRQQVEGLSSTWLRKGSPGWLLLPPDSVGPAERWLRERRDDLSALEISFIEKSLEERLASLATLEAGRMHRRNLWITVSVVSVLGILLAGLVIWSSLKPSRNYFDLLTKGQQSRIQGQSSLALNYYNQAIELNAKNPRAYVDRANTFYSLGNSNAAIEDYKVCLSLDPNNLSALNGLALSYKSLGQFQNALPLYNRLLTINNGDLRTLRDRAMAYKKLGQIDLSIADYGQILQLATNDTQTQSDLSEAHRIQLQQKAHDLLGQVLDIDAEIAQKTKSGTPTLLLWKGTMSDGSTAGGSTSDLVSFLVQNLGKRRDLLAGAGPSFSASPALNDYVCKNYFWVKWSSEHQDNAQKHLDALLAINPRFGLAEIGGKDKDDDYAPLFIAYFLTHEEAVQLISEIDKPQGVLSWNFDPGPQPTCSALGPR